MVTKGENNGCDTPNKVRNIDFSNSLVESFVTDSAGVPWERTPVPLPAPLGVVGNVPDVVRLSVHRWQETGVRHIALTFFDNRDLMAGQEAHSTPTCVIVPYIRHEVPAPAAWPSSSVSILDDF